MPRYIVALGSSHEQGHAYIIKAGDLLRQSKYSTVVGQSKIFRNASTNTLHNYLFCNCALAIQTKLEPRTFYRELFMLEHRLGRIRSYPNAPRTIDLDVLLSLDLTYISPHFFVPHKSATERNFFVIPAIDALKSARWPLPHELLKSGMKFGKQYLQLFTS